jgi:hypothetical protein
MKHNCIDYNRSAYMANNGPESLSAKEPASAELNGNSAKTAGRMLEEVAKHPVLDVLAAIGIGIAVIATRGKAIDETEALLPKMPGFLESLTGEGATAAAEAARGTAPGIARLTGNAAADLTASGEIGTPRIYRLPGESSIDLSTPPAAQSAADLKNFADGGMARFGLSPFSSYTRVPSDALLQHADLPEETRPMVSVGGLGLHDFAKKPRDFWSLLKSPEEPTPNYFYPRKPLDK